MYDLPNGEYFRVYLASNDLTTAADLVILDRDGNPRPLAAGERPVIEFLGINNGGTAAVITIFQDNNGGGTLDAGEELYRTNLLANAQGFMDAFPLLGKKAASATNGKLKAVASAASANTTIIATGTILKT